MTPLVLEASSGPQTTNQTGPRGYWGEFFQSQPEPWESFLHQQLGAWLGCERRIKDLQEGAMFLRLGVLLGQRTGRKLKADDQSYVVWGSIVDAPSSLGGTLPAQALLVDG